MAPEARHERLSALDATFLGIEDRCCHMHIGSVGVFEAPDGGDASVTNVPGVLLAAASPAGHEVRRASGPAGRT